SRSSCWIGSASPPISSDPGWISQEPLLVRRYRSVPRLGRQDQGELEKRAAKNRYKIEAIWSRSGVAPERTGELFSTMMDSLRVFAEHADHLNMSTTVTYRDVVVDAAIAPADFEFQVPSGIPRKTSLLDGSP